MLTLKDYIMYLKYYKKNLYLRFLKYKKGLDFTGRINDSDVQKRGYEGCYPVNSILKKLHIQQNDAILDIGCGKGLFLYYASKYPFFKIDGLEYSSSLVQTAQKNCTIISDSRIHIFNCDARVFTNYAEYNMFFLNNPFSEDIMKQVVTEIKSSFLTSNRKHIIVIYQFPFNIEVFLNQGFHIIYDNFPNVILIFDK